MPAGRRNFGKEARAKGKDLCKNNFPFSKFALARQSVGMTVCSGGSSTAAPSVWRANKFASSPTGMLRD